MPEEAVWTFMAYTLIAAHPDDPAVQTVVSGFELARHPVSLNGSRVLRPRGEITLYVALDNKTS